MAASSPQAERIVHAGLSVSPSIEFIDLKAQQDRIRRQIDRAIRGVLDHGQYIMGPEVVELERKLAAFTGAKHVISCASGTDALLIAMMAKGVGPGDAILCPAFTYTATPESIALLGATPIFVDVGADTFNIVGETKIEAGIATARHRKLRPVGVIVVDLFGLPADYRAIREIAERERLWILADAAQSFGATYLGAHTGTLGDITATSFFPAKPLGCYGDGGAIFTNDDALADVMKSIRLHGRGDDKYDIVRFGINGRLDTLQAAVLIAKLDIFKDEIVQRQGIANRYANELCDIVTVPTVPEGLISVWAQYTIRIAGGKRDALAMFLANEGIPTQIYYPKGVHEQVAYRHFPVAGNGVPVAENLSREVISLPMHPYLSDSNQQRIIDAVRSAVVKLH
jgi:dTDP-4-amino-4,6-dideoxygalactose transaminase